MSLATRCTACGTIFRVVQDQLKVSEGWVRCGRCDTVFNAVEALFDLERGTPPAWQGQARPPAAPGPQVGASAPAREPDWQAPPRRDGLAPPPTVIEPPTSAPAWQQQADAQLTASQPALNELLDDADEPPLAGGLPPEPVGTAPAGATDDERVDISALLMRPDVSEADATLVLPEAPPAPLRNPFHSAPVSTPHTIDTVAHDPVWQSPEFDAAPPAPTPPHPEATATTAQPASGAHTVDIPLDGAVAADTANGLVQAGPDDGDDAAAAAAATPRFVAQADRAARWRRPLPRALLSLLALGLAALLAGQVALQQRDLWAQQMPWLRPVLEAGCAQLGCSIQLPRRIDDLVVESSALTPAPEAASGALRLSVGVRNRGELTLALPAIDLQLTDASGQPVLRRALSPADFGQKTPAAIGPGAEAQLQLVFASSGPRVTGYTVEVFYP